MFLTVGGPDPTRPSPTSGGDPPYDSGLVNQVGGQKGFEDQDWFVVCEPTDIQKAREISTLCPEGRSDPEDPLSDFGSAS